MKASEYINYLVNGETYKLAIQDVGDLSVNPSSSPTTLQETNRKKFILISQNNFLLWKELVR